MSPQLPTERILAPAGVQAWRDDVARQGGSVAVVTGTFDLLQPGNIAAVARAARAASHVCLVLEGDDDASRHTRRGRPQYSLPERAELVAHLRGVHAITSFASADASRLFRHLSPFTWLGCRAQGAADALGPPATDAAQSTVALPALAGCFSDDIAEAIRAGRTPVPLPAGLYEPVRSDDTGAGAAIPGRATVNGCFDVLHIGHARFLSQAAALGNDLTVLINDDNSVRRYKGPTRPVFPAAFRRAALLAMESVAHVYAFQADDPLSLLARIRPAIHVKGGTYEPDRVRQERGLLEQWGGRVEFCPLIEGYSTTAYIRGVLGST